MQELDDNALLREYSQRDSEEAFAALVTRHVDKVYSVALRHTGNPHQAEEITQAVFVILARKCRQFRKGVILEGWLYQTARFTAQTLIRGEIRRARREQEAHMQSTLNENESEVWKQIAPLLDDAMAGLNETDRHAVVLRFFYGKSMKEIGDALGGNEGAVRTRLHRAMEKLRQFFLKRGIASTAAIIAAAISANSIQAAPAALAKSATVMGISKGAAAGSSNLTLIKGALKIMAWTKAKTAIVVGIGVFLAAGSTVSVKEYMAYRVALDSWRIPRFDPNTTVAKALPQVRILPTKFKPPVYGQFWAPPDKWAGVRVPVVDMVHNSYNWPPGRILFPDGEPKGRFDYAATLSHGASEALRKEIKKQFGIVGHRETVDMDVLVLKLRHTGAPGLKPHPAGPRTLHYDIRGHIMCMGGPIGYPVTPDGQLIPVGLVRYLESFVNMPVVDDTDLTGPFDIDLKWNERGEQDPNHDALRQVLLDQLGMELVPDHRPVEMLVMKKEK